MTFDELRASRPNLGIAVYAYTAGETVTLELHDGSSDPYTFVGATLQEAIDKAFPPPPVITFKGVPIIYDNDLPNPTGSVFD